MALSSVAPPLDFGVTEGELRHLGNGLFGPKARGRGICDITFSVKQTKASQGQSFAEGGGVVAGGAIPSVDPKAKPKVARKHQSGSPWPILGSISDVLTQPVQLPLEPKDQALAQLQSTVSRNRPIVPTGAPTDTDSSPNAAHLVELSPAVIRSSSTVPKDTLSKCKRAQTSIAMYGHPDGLGPVVGLEGSERKNIAVENLPQASAAARLPSASPTPQRHLLHHSQLHSPHYHLSVHRSNSISGCLSPNRWNSTLMQRSDPFAAAARAAAVSPILAPPLAHRLRKSQLHQLQSGRSSADLDRTVPCPVPKLVQGPYFGKHKIPFPANECIALLK